MAFKCQKITMGTLTYINGSSMPTYMPHMNLLQSMILRETLYTDDDNDDDCDDAARLHRLHLAKSV